MPGILVIEDEQSLREEILDVLEFEGFQAIGAENGRVGVEMAQAHLPQLIISDIMMPEMDGYGVLTTLRANPETTVIPFIFLSAKTERDNVRQGMELGANDYLTKPFTRAELLGAVRTRLAEQENLSSFYEQKMVDLRTTIIHTLPHELRTPLVSILGFAELLAWDAEELTTAQIQKMAQAILQGGKRLHRLVENYLLYAQIEVISTDPRKLQALRENETTDPVRTIAETAKAQAQSVEREEELALRLDGNPPVQISEDDVKKITEELVDNAFKFSEKGTAVQVTATIRGSWYQLRIEDEGRGMTANQIRDISAYKQFDREIFEQQGSGLGLVIAKRLAEMYGGEIVIDSAPEQGTRVTVNLPLAH